MTMNKRGGPPVKLFIIAAAFMGCVYFIYVYHTKLRDAEATAERYRRSDEAKVGQLQDSMKEKDVLQQKCETDRQEFLNRLNSLNSQHKMLKGQHDELEAENGRLQQDVQKLRDDNANVEAQRTQEFNQMKQEKELEIASLKDQLANMKRQNDQLQNEISSLKSQLENSQKQLIVDQGSIRNIEKESQTQKQHAAAAVQAMHDYQQQQQQNQGFQQQNAVQQNNQAQVNSQDLVNRNQNLGHAQLPGQGQAQLLGQGQAQLLGQGQAQVQGQAQLQGQGLQMDGIQNMNQNIDLQNVGKNLNGQIPAAAQETAVAAAQLKLQQQQQQQGQVDFNNMGQAAAADGQLGVDNAQHQMEAPHMGDDALNPRAANQRDFVDIEVRRGNIGDDSDAFGNLKPDTDQENARDVDVDNIVPPVHVEGNGDADKYDDVADDDNVPDDKEEIENAHDVDVDNIVPPVHVEGNGDADKYDDVADKEENGQQLQKDENNGGEVDVENAQRGVLAQPNNQQGDQDVAHPDIVQNDGQMFNLNKFDVNDEKSNNEDNYHNGDHPPEEDGDHDNRMQNEGPVNLQVQEPPNRNFDIPQHLQGGLDLNRDIQPLQAQGQGNEQGQILMPDIGLPKHKDGDVRVEGEGRKEAPMPHERDM